MTMRTRRLALSSALLCLVVAGCSTDAKNPERDVGAAGFAPSSSPSALARTFSVPAGAPMPTKVPAAEGLVTTHGPITVIARGRGVPEACLGGVRTSYPPQCGGPKLVGFDWADYPGHFVESHKVRFGDFALTGHFDGTTFRVTMAVPLAEYDEPQDSREYEPLDMSTPCPEPAGGWRVVDPDRTNRRGISAALNVARHLPGFAKAWRDRSRVPSDTGPSPAADLASDPTHWITVNVQVTRDLPAATRALRRVWGGALCVTKAPYSLARLSSIQSRMTRLPGMFTAGSGSGRVEVSVIHDDGSLQAWADATYGPGLVTVTSALTPVD